MSASKGRLPSRDLLQEAINYNQIKYTGLVMNSDSFSKPPIQISRSISKGVPLESERVDEYSGKMDNRLVMIGETSTEVEASVSTGWAAETSQRMNTDVLPSSAGLPPPASS